MGGGVAEAVRDRNPAAVEDRESAEADLERVDAHREGAAELAAEEGGVA